MKDKAWKAIALALMVNLVGMVMPSWGQDLNAELNVAVCHQNWQEAIEIIDRAREIAAEPNPQLEAYRDRLVTLKDSEARLPEWGENCTPSESSGEELQADRISS